MFADVAQLVEHPICNRAVASSILAVSLYGRKVCAVRVGYSSGQREQTVNLPAYAFEGSNPSPTILRMKGEGWAMKVDVHRVVAGGRSCGSSSAGRAQAFQA